MQGGTNRPDPGETAQGILAKAANDKRTRLAARISGRLGPGIEEASCLASARCGHFVYRRSADAAHLSAVPLPHLADHGVCRGGNAFVTLRQPEVRNSVSTYAARLPCPIDRNFERRSSTSFLRDIPESCSRNFSMHFPTDLVVAPMFRCAPPVGSRTIWSITPRR